MTSVTHIGIVLTSLPATGMHKNFRMIAIHDFMTNQGVINPSDEHTRISGIWEKLGKLYNLPILDDREDSIMNDIPDDNGQIAELYSPFTLPEEEYGALMFERRLDPNGSKSPDQDLSRRESTVADTDELGSSPAPGRRSGRTFRTPAKAGRVSKLQKEIENSRRTSKASSVAEDETMEDVVEDDDGVESGGHEEESGDDGDASQSSKANNKRGRGAARGTSTRGRAAARRSGRKR